MTRLSLSGKFLGAAFLLAACLLTTAGTALSGGQAQAQKKIQIKIIVDGKEIDLDDAKLWEHIEAAKAKVAGDPKVGIPRTIGDVKPAAPATPASPATPAVPAKQIAFSPDGRVITTGNGKHVIVVDAATGKVLAQVNQGNQDAKQEIRFLTQVQAKADPRIEELVKQAEAIKPGSGAAIRRALEATPKAGANPVVNEVDILKFVAPNAGVQIREEGGKKVIILSVDGKALQLGDMDAAKLLEKGLRIQIEADVVKQKAEEKKAQALEWLLRAQHDKAVVKKAAPAPVDLEALSRQLERLNAEVSELRKRLDAGKK